MVRKRVGGRFVRESAGAPPVEPEAGAARKKAPRPKYCRTFARARFAEALPEIAETLLRFAKQGSVPHMKLLIELSGLHKGDVVPRAMKRPGKSLEAILMEGWERDREGSDEGIGERG